MGEQKISQEQEIPDNSKFHSTLMRMQINRIIDELSRDIELTELNFTHSVQKNGWECGFNNLALLKKYLENSKSKRHSIKETDTNEVLEILKNLMRRFF